MRGGNFFNTTRKVIFSQKCLKTTFFIGQGEGKIKIFLKSSYWVVCSDGLGWKKSGSDRAELKKIASGRRAFGPSLKFLYRISFQKVGLGPGRAEKNRFGPPGFRARAWPEPITSGPKMALGRGAY